MEHRERIGAHHSAILDVLDGAVVGVRVETDDPQFPITASVLRRVPLAALQRGMRVAKDRAHDMIVEPPRMQVGRPRTRSDYRAIWKRYLALAPTRHDYARLIAEEFGRNRSTIRSDIRRARAMFTQGGR